MAEHPLAKAVRQILRSLTPPSGDTDAHLLMRFAQRGDEEAFALLLQRHGPMVWRTCRRMARQVADAEDAFQATFLDGSVRAGSVSDGRLFRRSRFRLRSNYFRAAPNWIPRTEKAP